MSIPFYELNPTCLSFKLNGNEYEIRPFDLTAQVWARCEFATKDESDGLVVLSELIQDMNNFDPLLKSIWHLLKRKRDFGFYEEFVLRIDKGDKDSNKVKILSNLYVIFTNALQLSQPNMNDIEEDLDLKKSLTAESLKQKPVTQSFMIYSLFGIIIVLSIFIVLHYGKFLV